MYIYSLIIDNVSRNCYNNSSVKGGAVVQSLIQITDITLCFFHKKY